MNRSSTGIAMRPADRRLILPAAAIGAVAIAGAAAYDTWPPAFLALMLVGAPTVEEILFRDALWSWARNGVGLATKPTIVLCAAAFAAAHYVFISSSPDRMAWTASYFLMGILFGFARARFDLMGAISAHAMSNACFVLFEAPIRRIVADISACCLQ